MTTTALAYADPRREAKERYLALLQEKARRAQAKRIEAEAGGWAEERRKCAADINYWWDRYVWTYDPRLIGKRDPETGEKLTPFIRFHPWPKQRDLVAFLHARVQAEEEGLVEKSRDTGVTYVCGVYALHRWLFDPGFKATFGSRKAELVDKRDQPDSIFQKLRIIIQRLPEQLLPRGYDPGRHDNHMRLFNPETGAMISGEGGDDMGRGGRAQPLTAKVLTPTGWVTMGDIQPGDLVIGADGKPTRVASVHPQGVKPLFRVTMSDGASTECCDDHLWQVTDRACRKVIARKGNRTYGTRHHVLPLSAIRDGLTVIRPDGQVELQYRVPMVGAVEMAGAPLPLHPYLIGSLLGDGSLSQIHKAPPGFTTADEESVETIRELLPDGFDIRSGGGAYDYRIVTIDGGRHGPGKRNAVKQALVDLGVAGHTAATKSIPAACMAASAADRLEVLRGLLDTDGWASRRKSNRASAKVGFSTISPRLADDVVALVRSLGGTAVITTRPGQPREFPGGRTYDCQRSYQVTIAMPAGVNPFRLKRKAALHQDRTKYQPTRSIAKVEAIEPGEAKCITVEAEDGLYVTDDYIVTHNSTVYFVDEAAFVENAEIVEKALSGNTDCVIWVSTVNGMGNLFARKRHSVLKPHQVFRYHWTDDPRKTPEWAAAKEASYSDPTGWASEYDIDYSASVEGICIPAKWVESCKALARLEPRLKPANLGRLGVDVGGGKAKSVAVARFGPVALVPTSRGDADTTATGHWAIAEAERTGCRALNFDAVGIGAGVSSTLMNNPVAGLSVHPINTGVPPTERVWPDERTSQEMFGNLKAELWWLGRTAAQRTHEHVLWLKGDPLGVEHDVGDLLALPAGDVESDALCLQLSLVKWGRNEKGKIVIETKQALARRGISSPDYAEAFLLTYAEGETGYDSNMAAWV